jgi:cytochrome c-type biogenesis protein CcmH/NrfG
MPSKRAVRFDQVFLIAAGCLIVGYLLGIGTAVLIQGRPTPAQQPVSAPAPTVAPPSSALGSYSAEIGELRNIVAQDPDNYDVWVRLGNTYFDTDQYMESIEAYTRALEIRPGDPNVITDRAIMYRRIGDFERAAAGFREAAALDPTHLNSALNLGVVLRYDMNDVAGATEAWQMYLDRNPPPEMAEKVKQWIQALQTQE